MACYFTENVHTKSFTPREYQIELLDAGRERNIIVCLNPGSNRTFVSLKLLLELSVDIRRSKTNVTIVIHQSTSVTNHKPQAK
ncbi:unnamed protein product [Nezara viridula]|uniref:Uncharacterized protein n=1 Tax=Nezara viridula TaxID=85310 RepID=A0A9P0HHM9_NEZVI|nr:unnamed protein product [Nezara viridula]